MYFKLNLFHKSSLNFSQRRIAIDEPQKRGAGDAHSAILEKVTLAFDILVLGNSIFLSSSLSLAYATHLQYSTITFSVFYSFPLPSVSTLFYLLDTILFPFNIRFASCWSPSPTENLYRYLFRLSVAGLTVLILQMRSARGPLVLCFLGS